MSVLLEERKWRVSTENISEDKRKLEKQLGGNPSKSHKQSRRQSLKELIHTENGRRNKAFQKSSSEHPEEITEKRSVFPIHLIQ